MRRSAIEEARRWLEQATDDLKWADLLNEAGGYHLVCFLSQQVAEKAIKAFLYAQGESPVLGHSVAVLGERAGSYAEEMRLKSASWAVLDGYYVATRYPNGLPDSIPSRVYNRPAATEAARLARDVVETVSVLLSM
jgi:HEPN domain-containing protein